MASVNPTPLAGELVWESDTNRLKVGDGTTSYNSLPYLTTSGGSGVTDGDKGDIVVSGSGATWSIDSGVLSTFGRSLIDDADAAAARATLGAVSDSDARLSDTRTPTDNSVSTAKLQDDAVTYAKIQNVSATDRLLGRSSAGAGDVQEITCTAFGRSLIDDADAATARTTLGASAVGHVHAASEITSGTLATARLGSGTADATTFLRGDGSWAVPAGGGGSFSGGTLTSALLVIPGTAAAPGLAISGDANTGLYQDASAADTISVAANGAEVARFGSTRHQVNRDTLFSGTSGVLSGNAGVIFASGTNHFRLSGNTTSQFTVARVSSLATTPDEDACLRVVSLNASDTRAQIQVGAFNSLGFPQYTFIADTNTGLTNPAADSLSLVTNGADRVRVDSSGRVGIGTTSPSQLLQVNGTAQITSLTDGTTTRTLSELLSSVGSRPVQAGGGVAVNNMVVMTAAAYAALATKDPNTLYFVT